MDKAVSTFVSKLQRAVNLLHLTHVRVIYSITNIFVDFDRLSSLKVMSCFNFGGCIPEENGVNYPNIRLLLYVRMKIISPIILNQQS